MLATSPHRLGATGGCNVRTEGRLSQRKTELTYGLVSNELMLDGDFCAANAKKQTSDIPLLVPQQK